jgi:signal transduction histidine kinase
MAGVSRRRLAQLKWLTTIVPAVTVFGYETVRHDLLEPLLPPAYGNLIVGLLTLALAWGFSELVFGIVDRLQAQAVARSREVATLQGVLQERERLSRELHDGLAQLVASMLVRLDTVAALLDAGRAREAAAEVERLRGVADDLYADIRESIAALRTRVSERGLPATLRDELAAFEERHGVAVDLRGAELATGLPPSAEYQLLRVVQEALANVRKHAGAGRDLVAFARPEPDLLELTVGDDGRGFAPAAAAQGAARSFGLAMMRERVEGLGGALRVESAPGCGTRVIARVPLDSAAPSAIGSEEGRDARAAAAR